MTTIKLLNATTTYVVMPSGEFYFLVIPPNFSPQLSDERIVGRISDLLRPLPSHNGLDTVVPYSLIMANNCPTIVMCKGITIKTAGSQGASQVANVADQELRSPARKKQALGAPAAVAMPRSPRPSPKRKSLPFSQDASGSASSSIGNELSGGNGDEGDFFEDEENDLAASFDDLSPFKANKKVPPVATTCDNEPDKKVIIENIPPPFFEGILTSLLTSALKLKSLMPVPKGGLVVKYGQYVESSKSVVVEFENEAIAEEFAKIGKLPYQLEEITFRRYAHTNVAPSASVPCVNDSTMDTAKEEVVWRNDWPGYEKCRLLVACISNRTLLRSRCTKDISRGWEKVAAEMAEHDLYYKVDDMKKRLTGMRKYRKTAASGYDYASLLDEYEGIGSPGSGIVPEKFKTQIVAFPPRRTAEKRLLHNVAVLDDTVVGDILPDGNYTEDMFLIVEYKRLKPKFDDNKTRNKVLYQEMSENCIKEGFSSKFTAEYCAQRMAQLGKVFKEKYDALRFKSGGSSEPRDWIYWDAMSQVFGNSSILEPRKLIALGEVNEVSVRGQVPCNKNSSDKSGKTKKTPSPPTKAPTLKERNILVKERLADLLEKVVAGDSKGQDEA